MRPVTEYQVDVYKRQAVQTEAAKIVYRTDEFNLSFYLCTDRYLCNDESICPCKAGIWQLKIGISFRGGDCRKFVY